MTVAGKGAAGTAKWVDDRLGAAGYIRKTLGKVFPDHWSFMLGEIALYSFIILLLTGTYLTLFFDPSTRDVIYNGHYVPLRGITMSQAYESTLRISFDVRGGLIIRQIHHWAALLFMAAIVVHLFRVFFTGAFRKPRELNWLIGVGLVTLGLVEGFAGYSLPDDLLSGTGLRIAYSIALSVPVVGTWAAFLLFGGEFPGTSIIDRLYAVHILLVPGIILGLITFHMLMIWYQKHTQFPGPGRTEHNVVGSRLYPTYAAKAGGFFFLVFAVLAALGGLAQINPIWLYGPYNPAQVSAGSQPDWYIGFLDGSTRLMPNWEFRGLGHTIPFNVLLPTVVLPGLLFTLMAVYPWIEARRNKDKGFHNLLDRPRDVPVRTGLGVMSITFYLILLLAGGNDIIAGIFHLSINTITYTLRTLIIILPPIAYLVTKRICLGLQHGDEHLLHHGIETGTIRRLPSGEYVEETVPLPASYQVTIGAGPEHHAAVEGAHPDTGHGAPVAVAPAPAAVVSTPRRKGFFFPKGGDPEAGPAAEQAALEPSGKPAKPE
ncbi:MAG: ubiquinol-cytochrome c reductase cytochrome b subunit [Actinomycetota bacterium]|nr:ubiquinol-cytochrome c reductase cytochrome b subunit [Actinomycetota bacterium]